MGNRYKTKWSTKDLIGLLMHKLQTFNLYCSTLFTASMNLFSTHVSRAILVQSHHKSPKKNYFAMYFDSTPVHPTPTTLFQLCLIVLKDRFIWVIFWKYSVGLSVSTFCFLFMLRRFTKNELTSGWVNTKILQVLSN